MNESTKPVEQMSDLPLRAAAAAEVKGGGIIVHDRMVVAFPPGPSTQSQE